MSTIVLLEDYWNDGCFMNDLNHTSVIDIVPYGPSCQNLAEQNNVSTFVCENGTSYSCQINHHNNSNIKDDVSYAVLIWFLICFSLIVIGVFVRIIRVIKERNSYQTL